MTQTLLMKHTKKRVSFRGSEHATLGFAVRDEQWPPGRERVSG
jgi:hypothetical protein